MGSINSDLSLIGTLIFMCYPSSVIGLLILILNKIKHKETSTLQRVIWWHLEIISFVSITTLIYRFFFMEISDKQSQGMLSYILLLWLAPLVTIGVIGFFLKPENNFSEDKHH